MYFQYALATKQLVCRKGTTWPCCALIEAKRLAKVTPAAANGTIQVLVEFEIDYTGIVNTSKSFVCCTQANISTLARAAETACAGHQANESQS